MTKHTPGPWVCHSGMVWKDGPEVWPQGQENGIPIARMDRDTPETAPTERDANAHLIAAAPDLFQALDELVAEFDADSAKVVEDGRGFGLNETFGIELARAALAKATAS